MSDLIKDASLDHSVDHSVIAKKEIYKMSKEVMCNIEAELTLDLLKTPMTKLLDKRGSDYTSKSFTTLPTISDGHETKYVEEWMESVYMDTRSMSLKDPFDYLKAISTKSRWIGTSSKEVDIYVKSKYQFCKVITQLRRDGVVWETGDISDAYALNVNSVSPAYVKVLGFHASISSVSTSSLNISAEEYFEQWGCTSPILKENEYRINTRTYSEFINIVALLKENDFLTSEIDLETKSRNVFNRDGKDTHILLDSPSKFFCITRAQTATDPMSVKAFLDSLDLDYVISKGTIYTKTTVEGVDINIFVSKLRKMTAQLEEYSRLQQQEMI